MAWDSRTVFIEGLGFFGTVVDKVEPEAWDRPSPCARWRGLDVLGHVGAAVGFGTSLLSGEQPEWSPVDPPGKQVDGDPVSWWRALVAPAREAVTGADLDEEVGAPGGQRSVSQGLSFPAVDLFVHGWDLARTTGRRVEIPAEVIAFAHALLDPMPSAQLRTGAVFGPEVAVDGGADTTASFVGWTGRDPDWRPA